jgi:hypothetical protein
VHISYALQASCHLQTATKHDIQFSHWLSPVHFCPRRWLVKLGILVRLRPASPHLHSALRQQTLLQQVYTGQLQPKRAIHQRETFMNQQVLVCRLLLLLMCKYQWEVIKTGCLIALTGFFSARPDARISNDTSIAMSLPSTAAPASSSSLAVLSYTPSPLSSFLLRRR